MTKVAVQVDDVFMCRYPDVCADLSQNNFLKKKKKKFHKADERTSPCTNSTTHSEAKAKEINRIINHKCCFRSKNVTHWGCQVRLNICPLYCVLKARWCPCFEPLYNRKAGVCNRWEHCQPLKSKTWSVSSPNTVIVIHLHVMIPLNTSYRRQ